MLSKRLSGKIFLKKYTMQIIDKTKTDNISNTNFNKNNNNNNKRISKIPVHFRYSCQDKRMFLKNKFINNENKDCNDNNTTNKNEFSTKKDKNYYLKILDEIYLNDSHYSNDNNKIKKESSIKESKKILRKKTCNFQKLKSFKDNQILKISKSSKKLIYKFNNGNKNNSSEKNNKMTNNNKNNTEKKENIKSKHFIQENTIENQYKQFPSDNYISKFMTTDGLIKVKTKENYQKFRSSKKNIDEDKYIKKKLNEPLDYKDLSKLSKLNNINIENKLGNNKRSRNNENQFENEKVGLENTTTKNISNKNILSGKSVKKKKYIKMCQICFCCLTKNNDDSF
jgi:hypothetical protein